MSTIYKKTLALLATTALLAGTLCGCATGKGSKANAEPAYQRQYIQIDPSAENALSSTGYSMYLSDEKTLLYAHQQPANTEGNLPVIWYRMDLETGEQEELYRANYTYDSPLINFALDRENKYIWLIEYTTGNLMEGGTQASSWYLRMVELQTGNAQWGINLSTQIGTQIYGASVAIDDSNGVYVLCEREAESKHCLSLIRINPATKTISDPHTFSELSAGSLLTLADGRVGIVPDNSDVSIVQPIQKNACQPDSVITLSEKVKPTAIFGGNENHLFVYEENQKFFGYDAVSGTVSPIVSWNDWGVQFNEQHLVWATACNDTLVCVVNDTEFGVYTLSRCKSKEAAPKMLVAGYNISDAVKTAATAFNRMRFDYTVTLEEYSQYSTQLEITQENEFRLPEGYTKLNTELSAGKGIDILCLDERISTAALIRQEGLLDLYTLIDKDENIDRNYFVQGLLPVMETEGHLYHLPIGFTIETLIGSRDYLGNLSNLDIDTLRSLEKKHPSANVLPRDFSRLKFLNYLTDTALYDYVDAERSTCSFTDGNFAKYLEKSSELLTGEEIADLLFRNQLGADVTNASVANGTYLLIPQSINGFMFYQRYLSDLSGKAVFAGYPTENGVGHIMRFEQSLGILSNSKHKDAAWDFLKLFLSQNQYDFEKNSGSFYNYFPTDQASFNALLEYYKDETNFYFSKTFEGNPALAFTENDVKQLYTLITTAKPVTEYDAQIYTIIAAEASYYYAGESTVNEAVQNIQNRVQLYLDEQR